MYEIEASRKKPKTLSGIETLWRRDTLTLTSAGKNLKPYQGLKLRVLKAEAQTLLLPEKT